MAEEDDLKEPRTLANLSFPVGGSAKYTRETIAQQDTVMLTGRAQVDVSWGTPDDVNAATVLGTMSLTISDLASAVGDPLSQGGSGSDRSEAPGSEIADVVFPGISIIVGGQGDFPNNMIAGTAGTADDDGNIPYGEASVTSGPPDTASSLPGSTSLQQAPQAPLRCSWAKEWTDRSA